MGGYLRYVKQSVRARARLGRTMPPDDPATPPAAEPLAGRKRPPTAAEARALGHPLRLRILFACRERARTNKELAEALGSTPGTIHYHLKPLVTEGFLHPEKPRPGPRGSVEQPYRSTGKSWELSGTPRGARTILEVGVDELEAARAEAVVHLTRLGLTLRPADVEELDTRLGLLVEEFAGRSLTRPGSSADDRPADAASFTLFVALHRPDDGGPARAEGGKR
jgi:DNA-binding transcriptional ArsR family regulator